MNSAEYSRTASALTKLLRDELRVARFSVAQLARADAEFVPSEYGGTTMTSLEEKFKKEVDADGLRALHDAGTWKQDIFRREFRVKTLPRRSAHGIRTASR